MKQQLLSKFFPVLAITASLFLGGCATSPPKDPDNICAIFKEHRSWYNAAKDAREKWGVPVHVPLAMMYQESSFKHDAAPPMEYFLWIIPIGRASDAYGYAQAKTMTWDDYVRETGNSWASRSDFDDAMDFMGWFIYKSHKINGVSKWDARNQYLNYHEGWGGYKRGSYRSKAWLVRVADKVDNRSRRYAAQYNQCKEDLDASWLWRLFFD
ncbi:transglycosylase SLT domain-containing protein [Shewanella carassii]|uniref:transglycosylase SLT domain-containing protein n=1 Tax=Shewanella carassii TaxID=1987584 RepID=UPI003570A0F1